MADLAWSVLDPGAGIMALRGDEPADAVTLGDLLAAARVLASNVDNAAAEPRD